MQLANNYAVNILLCKCIVITMQIHNKLLWLPSDYIVNYIYIPVIIW